MRRLLAALLCLLISLNVAAAVRAEIGNAVEHAGDRLLAMDGWPDAVEAEHHHHAATPADHHPAHEAIGDAAHGDHVHLSQCPGTLPAAEIRLPGMPGRGDAPCARLEKWASALPNPLERPPRARAV